MEKLTLTQAANLIGISAATLRRYIKAGYIIPEKKQVGMVFHYTFEYQKVMDLITKLKTGALKQ